MKEKTQIIFNILLFIAILSLIYTTVVITKNVNIIKTDALLFGMKAHNYSSCICYDKDGKTVNINPNPFYNVTARNN